MTTPYVMVRSIFNQGSLLYGYCFKGARDLVKLPVADGEEIVRGMLVGVNESDEAIEATDAASYTFVGVAANNPFKGYVYVWQKGYFKFVASGVTALDLGIKMMVVDSITVDNASDHSVEVGRLVKILSNTLCWIELNVAGTVGPPA
jgi:hypothetical protein